MTRGGWFLTGDYARYDADGYLWFLGRRDDIIKSFGYRVSPYEVERVLKSHPAVADCACVAEDAGQRQAPGGGLRDPARRRRRRRPRRCSRSGASTSPPTRRRRWCTSRASSRAPAMVKFCVGKSRPAIARRALRIPDTRPHTCPEVFRFDPNDAKMRPLKPLPNLIFMSRWLQLPLYLGLIVAQAIYVWLFWQELYYLVLAAFGNAGGARPRARRGRPSAASTRPTKLNETVIMLVVLGLIDVVMISNLLIMVIVGGYETFVSRMNLQGHPDQPEWLSPVNASVLKVKLATAIIGISSIHLLKTFINADALHREGADRADRDPHHLPALRAGDRGLRPPDAARPAERHGH